MNQGQQFETLLSVTFNPGPIRPPITVVKIFNDTQDFRANLVWKVHGPDGGWIALYVHPLAGMALYPNQIRLDTSEIAMSWKFQIMGKDFELVQSRIWRGVLSNFNLTVRSAFESHALFPVTHGENLVERYRVYTVVVYGDLRRRDCLLIPITQASNIRAFN